MKSVSIEIILAVVVGVAAWAIVVLSDSAGPDAEATTAPVAGQPVRDIPGGGSFAQSDVAGADWPIFRGDQALRGVAKGNLGNSFKLIWVFHTDGPIKSSVAVGGGKVFVASVDSNVYALNLLDGKRLWTFPTGGEIDAPPILTDGMVILGSSDSTLYAIDAQNGGEKWKYKTDGQILGSANRVRTVAGKMRIIFGSYDKKLHCVDAADGKGVWAYETKNFINGAPAIADGKAFFGNCEGIVYVVNIADGTLARKIKIDAPIVSSPAVVGRTSASSVEPRAYVGHYENEVVCVDLSDGKIIWRYDEMDGPVFSSPAVTDDYVVFGSQDERVHCIDRKTGKRVWVFKTGGNVDSSPVVCGDKVVFGSDDGRLYLLRLSDGAELWSYEIGQPITASPAVAGSAIIVGSEDGTVYAFGPK